MKRKKALVATILTVFTGIVLGVIFGMMFLNYNNAATKASDASAGKPNVPPTKTETMISPSAANTPGSESSSTSSSSSSPAQSSPIEQEKSSSPTQAQTTAAHLNGPVSDVIWSLPTTASAVFITIDDGWYPDESVLKIMHAQHIPISTFLIEDAAMKHPDFWRSYVAAGGDIENHTVSHPDLTKDTPEEVLSQIKTAENYLNSFSGATLFRPPYGKYNQTVCQAAYQAGIKHVIMWNATMDESGLQTYNGKPLAPGSIILLHWDPKLGSQLEKLLAILEKQHLGVASLPYALNHPNKFPIVWPTAEAVN
ncbi:putative xylanase/chitin deacetylase [Desulfosporosinus acidiphilus SJ4]|uniref:Putative xylanase/chitin deacetylase n=1 Tax=Desulfosporosinus acidiphilus (strain DSM 22704 / JCM 16185 / SJ4) TaxID=646529 RepID=I4D9J2_DESAJ|nr:polysaccharide deacetylase family protein [Desulfosporosinus acidiphilus]AFM42466.1 putative xylanase/chitin deacetylase [Desulfosporosinus acidiphilus SJ4]